MVELWYLDLSQGGTWAAGGATVLFASRLLCSPIICVSTATLTEDLLESKGVNLGNSTMLEVSFGGWAEG